MEGRIEDKREREEGEGLILSRTVFITKCPRISYPMDLQSSSHVFVCGNAVTSSSCLNLI